MPVHFPGPHIWTPVLPGQLLADCAGTHLRSTERVPGSMHELSVPVLVPVQKRVSVVVPLVSATLPARIHIADFVDVHQLLHHLVRLGCLRTTPNRTRAAGQRQKLWRLRGWGGAASSGMGSVCGGAAAG